MNITHTAYNEAETVPLPTSPSEDKRQKCVDKEIGGQIDRWECTYRGGVQAIVWLNESEWRNRGCQPFRDSWLNSRRMIAEERRQDRLFLSGQSYCRRLKAPINAFHSYWCHYLRLTRDLLLYLPKEFYYNSGHWNRIWFNPADCVIRFFSRQTRGNKYLVIRQKYKGKEKKY